MAPQPAYGTSQIRGQLGIGIDFALVEWIICPRVQSERTAQFDQTPARGFGGQRECNAGTITARPGVRSPMAKNRVCADIFDPTALAAPDSLADWSSSGLH